MAKLASRAVNVVASLSPQICSSSDQIVRRSQRMRREDSIFLLFGREYSRFIRVDRRISILVRGITWKRWILRNDASKKRKERSHQNSRGVEGWKNSEHCIQYTSKLNSIQCWKACGWITSAIKSKYSWKDWAKAKEIVGSRI